MDGLVYFEDRKKDLTLTIVWALSEAKLDCRFMEVEIDRVA